MYMARSVRQTETPISKWKEVVWKRKVGLSIFLIFFMNVFCFVPFFHTTSRGEVLFVLSSIPRLGPLAVPCACPDVSVGEK